MMMWARHCIVIWAQSTLVLAAWHRHRWTHTREGHTYGASRIARDPLRARTLPQLAHRTCIAKLCTTICESLHRHSASNSAKQLSIYSAHRVAHCLELACHAHAMAEIKCVNGIAKALSTRLPSRARARSERGEKAPTTGTPQKSLPLLTAPAVPLLPAACHARSRVPSLGADTACTSSTMKIWPTQTTAFAATLASEAVNVPL
jgi:hypothetical protein